MNNYKKILIVTICIFCLVGCDLSSKKIAENNLKGRPMISLLDGGIRFIYAENTGGMLSLGDKLADEFKFIIFQFIVAAFLVFLFVLLVVKKNIGHLQALAFILFISGGLGNLINRIFNDGKVIDFIVIKIFGVSTGIFNIADIYVTIGIAIFIFANVFTKNKIVEENPA